jgi:2'-5' RNA ligase
VLQTAVIVPVPEAEAVLDEWRKRASDPASAPKLPAHVTLVVPFVPTAGLDAALLDDLRDVAAAATPFEFELRETRRFPMTLYLAPDPPEPFVRLTEAIATRYPQHPPYSGAFDSIVPHLTVAEGAQPILAAAEAVARPLLPIQCAARELHLLEELEPGWHRWRTAARIPLG